MYPLSQIRMNWIFSDGKPPTLSLEGDEDFGPWFSITLKFANLHLDSRERQTLLKFGYHKIVPLNADGQVFQAVPDLDKLLQRIRTSKDENAFHATKYERFGSILYTCLQACDTTKDVKILAQAVYIWNYSDGS
jgi:hypothetical protein